jgi:hypothetical protein
MNVRCMTAPSDYALSSTGRSRLFILLRKFNPGKRNGGK